MNALNMNKQFLSVTTQDTTHSADDQRQRTRSERASSLALPLNSLLDFYDKQQEQCKSVTLLPLPSSGSSSIVRRHSSHYYPMLEDKQKPGQPNEMLVNMSDSKYCKSAGGGGGGVAVSGAGALPLAAIACAKQQQLVRVDTPVTPPPPIPRRLMRAKCGIWQTTTMTPNDGGQHQQQQHHQQQQQLETGNVFVYPSPQPITNELGLGLGLAQSASPLLVDIGSGSRGAYADADGISDDDRMSLENSVFDESLTSTPVKVAAVIGYRHVSKRNQRSSSSTVDSAYGSSLSSTAGGAASGSGGHSERFASSSTSADFRSRFSSVDTQSSLDDKPMSGMSCMDSPLAKDTTCRLERAALHDVMQKLNNNLYASSNSSNNNIINMPAIHNNNKLPAVPARKLPQLPAKLPPPPAPSSSAACHSSSSSSCNSASDCNSGKEISSVSASASTSSAGSGSSNISGATMSSSTVSSSLPASSGHHHVAQQPKRPGPPEPPMRHHLNSYDAMDIMPRVHAPTQSQQTPLTVRNKLTRNKPPPIVYPKLQQRQDSTLSSDSYSISSSPGYSSKLMETPLLATAPHSTSRKTTGPGLATRQPSLPMQTPVRSKMNFRQDSNISSDSFSQTSSPGYNSKLMEAPLLPSLSAKRLCSAPAPIICRQGVQHEPIEELEPPQTLPPLNKCASSTPSSLQTIVRFQNGAPHTMSLQHQIINRRKSSNPYITNGRLKFRMFQILINALALLAIAGGLAAYFNAYPTIKFVNKTIINTIHVEDSFRSFGKNPAPGTCLPIIVKFCQGPQIPYNYTVFPNYIGHFGQIETQVDLESYEALVDVRCYELVSLFLCTLFVPKCGNNGATVPPCKTLCTETMRRCGFFFDVFGLSLPEYLNCKLFKDFVNSTECVGLAEVRHVMTTSANPPCDGFLCDQNRCLPNEYVCDGYLDCMDQKDEESCTICKEDEIYCGDDRCIGHDHICDGVNDCPYAQDERNCLRLSERNGDVGSGVLEVFRMKKRQWLPACVKNWDRAVSPSAVCSLLGYSSVNATSVVTQRTHRPLLASVNVSTDIWKLYAKRRSTLMQEFANCRQTEDYPIAELTCSNFECGKVKRGKQGPSRRIIGGTQSRPGNWPFLAAILGGPEKVFYCAGVLISDQWVLTASHCVGNHTLIDLEDWTIQLGVTRRNSFTYTAQKVKVKAVIPHPQYNMAIAHDNDIALFQLATRVAFHEHLLPVCLPPPNVKMLRPEQLCTVIGWGKRDDKDPKSTYEYIINEVQVPIITRNQCDEWLDNLTVSEGMVCAGFDDGGKDACQGDSGGPLLCQYPGEKDRWFVGGIVSWGIMCAHPKLPGVYANVIKYVPWINEQIQKYSRPASEEPILKYDLHPGGPDILSKLQTGPVRKRKPYNYHNGKPKGIDFYDSEERK